MKIKLGDDFLPNVLDWFQEFFYPRKVNFSDVQFPISLAYAEVSLPFPPFFQHLLLLLLLSSSDSLSVCVVFSDLVVVRKTITIERLLLLQPLRAEPEVDGIDSIWFAW